jgi:hypothetical protein
LQWSGNRRIATRKWEEEMAYLAIYPMTVGLVLVMALASASLI